MKIMIRIFQGGNIRKGYNPLLFVDQYQTHFMLIQ